MEALQARRQEVLGSAAIEQARGTAGRAGAGAVSGGCVRGLGRGVVVVVGGGGMGGGVGPWVRGQGAWSRKAAV